MNNVPSGGSKEVPQGAQFLQTGPPWPNQGQFLDYHRTYTLPLSIEESALVHCLHRMTTSAIHIRECLQAELNAVSSKKNKRAMFSYLAGVALKLADELEATSKKCRE